MKSDPEVYAEVALVARRLGSYPGALHALVADRVAALRDAASDAHLTPDETFESADRSGHRSGGRAHHHWVRGACACAAAMNETLDVLEANETLQTGNPRYAECAIPRGGREVSLCTWRSMVTDALADEAQAIVEFARRLCPRRVLRAAGRPVPRPRVLALSGGRLVHASVRTPPSQPEGTPRPALHQRQARDDRVESV